MSSPLTKEELEALLAEVHSRPSTPAEEQRRFRRFDCLLECTFELEGRWHAGRVTSIGIGGLFLETSLTPVVDAPLSFTIYLPTPAEQLKSTGRVRYMEPEGLGVQFEALSPDEIWALISNFHLSEEEL